MSQASFETHVFFEGMFCQPGQPGRPISLVEANGCKKIVWNAPHSHGIAHGMHEFLPLEGNLTGLVLVFHCSGLNDYRMATKLMISQGFGVWRDKDNEELVVFPQEMMQHPQRDLALTGLGTHDDFVREMTEKHMSKLDECKMILKWFHPFKPPAYVVLRLDGKVVYATNCVEFFETSAHGWWQWNNDLELLTTHFHYLGNVDEVGLPKSCYTCLQKCHVVGTMRQYFRAVGGEKMEESRKRCRSEPSDMNAEIHIGREKKLRDYHILAHTVYRNT